MKNEEIIDNVAGDCAEWVKDRVRKALELKDFALQEKKE